RPRPLTRSPTTCSERPYIGEESTTEPPASTSRPSTSPSSARSAAFGPTSKVCHVPTPTTGSRSPLDGIGRVSSADLGAAAPVMSGKAALQPAARSSRRRLRSTARLGTGTACGSTRGDGGELITLGGHAAPRVILLDQETIGIQPVDRGVQPPAQ